METLIGLLVLALILAVAVAVPVTIVAWLYRLRVGPPETASLRLLAALEAVRRRPAEGPAPDR